MSKKPKKSRHRIPPEALVIRSDPIDERYQAEIDVSITRLERRYRRAQKALEAAERRAERARRDLATVSNSRRRAKQRYYDQLLLLVEERRRELREIELLMIPQDYNGRDHKRRIVRHEPGRILIPLGATTGERPKVEKPPIFPVITKQLPENEPEFQDFDDIYGEDW